MTCRDAREQLSALLDEALGAAERRALEAHLATCPECRRELEQLRATTTLLGRLPAVRAPAGFVDRVMTEAYRPGWPRRLLDALFVPLRVKVPLEAAAVLLVGVSALYVHQRTPEVQELARQEAREPSSAPAAAPPAPASETVITTEPPKPAAPAPSKARTRETEPAPSKESAAPEAKRKLAKDAAPREEAQQTAPAVAERPPAVSQAPAAPAARPDDARSAFTAKKEAQVESQQEAAAKAASPAGPERVAQPAAPSTARDTTVAGAREGPAAAAPPVATPAPEAQGRVGAAAPAPAIPPSLGASAEPPPAAKSRMAARLTRAVDASGRLTVPARAPAEQALDALLARLGGTRVGRLTEGDRGLIVIDVLVPGPRYRELIEGLGQIGRWVTEYESATLPARVRVEVALTVEP
jgi:hypothetical protein